MIWKNQKENAFPMDNLKLKVKTQTMSGTTEMGGGGDGVGLVNEGRGVENAEHCSNFENDHHKRHIRLEGKKLLKSWNCHQKGIFQPKIPYKS